jgi:hypothetical protein
MFDVFVLLRYEQRSLSLVNSGVEVILITFIKVNCLGDSRGSAAAYSSPPPPLPPPSPEEAGNGWRRRQALLSFSFLPQDPWSPLSQTLDAPPAYGLGEISPSEMLGWEDMPPPHGLRETHHAWPAKIFCCICWFSGLCMLMICRKRRSSACGFPLLRPGQVRDHTNSAPLCARVRPQWFRRRILGRSESRADVRVAVSLAGFQRRSSYWLASGVPDPLTWCTTLNTCPENCKHWSARCQLRRLRWQILQLWYFWMYPWWLAWFDLVWALGPHDVGHATRLVPNNMRHPYQWWWANWWDWRYWLPACSSQTRYCVAMSMSKPCSWWLCGWRLKLCNSDSCCRELLIALAGPCSFLFSYFYYFSCVHPWYQDLILLLCCSRGWV